MQSAFQNKGSSAPDKAAQRDGNIILTARWRRSGRMAGFIIALLLLVVMGGVVLRNARALIDNSRWVTHTHEVLGKLTATLSAVQDVETGTRGYLLTGDSRFLEPRAPALVAVEQLQANLRRLTADNAAQQRRLDRLKMLIGQKIMSSEKQLAAWEQGGFAAAKALIATGEGKEAMDAVRAMVEEMHREEARLLAERQLEVETGTRRTMLTLGAGLVISLGLLLAIFLLLQREIALRTRTEAALRRSEESLAVTLHSIGDAVLATDTEGRITLLNPVAEKLTGWPMAEARGRPIAEVFRIFNEETRQPAVIPVDDVLATGEIHGLANHTVLVARGGAEYAIADSAAPIRDADGRILGVVLVFRDTTEGRRVEVALQKSAAEIHDLYHSAPCGYHSLDASGAFVSINDTELRWLGYTREEMIGRNVAMVLAEESLKIFREEFPRFKERGAIDGLEIRLVRKDQSVFPALLSATAIRDKEGNYVSSRSTLFDITRRKRAEEELDRFFTLSLDFLCIASADGYFKRVSPAITDMLGWTTEEFLAKPYIQMVHPDDHAATLREVEKQVVAGQKVLHFENRYQHKDGSWRVLSWRSVPQPGGLMYATARDVTESKRAEEQIQQLNTDLQRHATRLENANRELETFSYSVSHDLRAPLRHVQGYVNMLTEELPKEMSETARRYLETITTAAREMGQLIDDLLAFSRMGRTELREGQVDLNQLVQEVRAGLEFPTGGREIAWTVASLPKVHGDAALIRQVLANLLGNAVKYTRSRAPARIEIDCLGEEDGWTVFFVRDNGAGFDMRYAGKLFGVFQRLHRSDEFEGSGIGLASVRRIITRHGGRVWAEAKENAGATFYFTLKPAKTGSLPNPARL